MTTFIGLIAEGDSDVDVIGVIVGKITTKPYSVGKNFVGDGCGKILGKCRAWAANLKARGCSLLILVHDLDTKNVKTLRNTLIDALTPAPISNYVIVIPVREIEAWLLADHEAIMRAVKAEKRLKKIPNPETIDDPKKRLRKEISRITNNRKAYVSTTHNKIIAQYAQLANLRRCSSFPPLENFVLQHFR